MIRPLSTYLFKVVSYHPPSSPFRYVSAPLFLFLFLEYTNVVSASEPLNSLFFLPRTFFSKTSILFFSFFRSQFKCIQLRMLFPYCYSYSATIASTIIIYPITFDSVLFQHIVLSKFIIYVYVLVFLPILLKKAPEESKLFLTLVFTTLPVPRQVLGT